MLKRLLLITLLLFTVMLAAAQDDQAQAEREIYTVLAYGDDVFEPDIWFASAAEDVGRTTATWRADGIGGLAFIDYLHFDEGIIAEQIDAVFNDDWFSTTLSNYAVWRENLRCDLGYVRLYEFTLQTNDIKYTMRYWIEIVGDDRALTVFIVFPADDPENLADYAERLYPDAFSCSGSVG